MTQTERNRPERAGDDEPALFVPGENCWRVASADRFAFIVDAADYFHSIRAAMLRARHRIILVGWDFDPRIRLEQGSTADLEGPDGLGDFFPWLVRRTPALEICLLRWDTGALLSLIRGNSLWTILRWKMHRRITLRFDAFHPFAASHHQKVVVIDDQVAFCGGIDVTRARWDRRDHLDDDPERRLPGGQPYDPWHDATSAISGEAAIALGELCRRRWQLATGEALAPVHADSDVWPADLEPTFRDVRVAISRTLPAMEGHEAAHEIETMYLDLIARARRSVYLESQYFASRRVARAIAERLTEDDGPEFVIINPESSEGWLEPFAMDSARARLLEALQRLDHHGRLRIYHPVTAAGRPIYVHAKLLIVDDRYLRVGSSNLNNRSMRLDTECDVVLSAEDPADTALRARITAVRDDLLAEHLGVSPAAVSASLAETGSLVATVEALRGPGRSLKPYVLPELSAAEEWLADNQILDPEGPEMMFESLARRRLFRGWSGLLRRRRRRRAARSGRPAS